FQRGPQIALAYGAHFGPRQRRRHGCEDEHDGAGHDQLDQAETTLVLATHPCSCYRTVTVICGLPVKTACPWVLRTVRLGTVTVVLPVPTAWNTRLTITPDPLTPVVCGRRFTLTMAVPASF